MAMNIFDYYGIKEVANVYFEALEGDAVNGYEAGDVVLYLDTLKVSTVEQTAENVSAQGGWSNPKLITWDYGKDINLNLEDAVISFEELRNMLGATLKEAASSGGEVTVHMVAECNLDDAGELTPVKSTVKLPVSGAAKYINKTTGKRGKIADIASHGLTATEGVERLVVFWEEKRDGTPGKEAIELTITPDRWPGTFKVIGDTLIRNKNGVDEAFQFIIGKAKMLSEITLTMQAEGDPSTFSMTLNVLRDDDGNMMKLVKY